MKGIGTANSKKVFEEGDMIKQAERKKLPAKLPAPASTWIQISFTLDPEHYQILWERAEGEHRTIPDLVRESVTEALKNV